jgi:hypothetical protein
MCSRLFVICLGPVAHNDRQKLVGLAAHVGTSQFVNNSIFVIFVVVLI